ncbi:MAG: gamma carbonic anhydrase family protein [Candidatus Aminicenantes bacterium]|nr:gamma carbonic anhydrase family protein [Candidatus Aminicenantes bacterium]
MKDTQVPALLASPQIHPQAWVAPGAVVLGDVRIARGASIWYGCILRGDLAETWVEVGEDTNIQDGAIVHVDHGRPCRVGARVTVGHRAVVHGATVGDDSLIGMGAVVLSGAVVGRGSIIAAGALVGEGVIIPDGTIAAGIPAKVRREMTDGDRARLDHGWRTYAALRDLHRGRKTP